jgi:hypothetical protein
MPEPRGAYVEDEFSDWLNTCGSCDAGLPMACICPPGDPRTVILTLVERADAVIALHKRVEVNYGEDADDGCSVCGPLLEYPCDTVRALLASGDSGEVR